MAKQRTAKKVSREIRALARQVLEFAVERAREVRYDMDLQNALFAPEGKATVLFATEAERTAFLKTPEYRKLLALVRTLPSPPVTEVIDFQSPVTGHISLTVPRAVHAALLAEAEAKGISLNELCLSKLVSKRRKVI